MAANFANAIANVFVKQNTDFQASRYASSRDNLAQLVSQLQSDINGRQAVVNDLQAQPASPERDAQLAQAQNGLDQLRTTYGNTLMGLACSKPIGPEDGYKITYYAPQPRAVVQVVDFDNPDHVVDYGQTGRVMRSLIRIFQY